MINCVDTLAGTYSEWDGALALLPGVTPAQPTQTQYRTAVTLARYAQKIRFDECSFWGVRNDTVTNRGSCLDIWTLEQREQIAYYLSESQVELEDVIGFPMQPTYVVGAITGDTFGDWRFVDQQPFYPMLNTKWNRVIEPGVKAAYLAGDSVAVSHVSDPAVIVHMAIPGITAEQVKIYHEDSNIQITPSTVTVSTLGLITVNVPRCRTVLPSLADNPEEGLDYSDLANFASAVDIVIECTDPSTQAVLLTDHSCSATCASMGCQQYTYNGCIVVEEPDTGGVRLSRGTYTGGQWIRTTNCSVGAYSSVQLNYLAGVRVLSPQMEDAIVRLAHSKMPTSPCGCNPANWMWARDRNTPETLTRERVNNPFGMSDGAWVAYRFAQSMRVQRAGVI